jgi:hypothetical protein
MEIDRCGKALLLLRPFQDVAMLLRTYFKPQRCHLLWPFLIGLKRATHSSHVDTKGLSEADSHLNSSSFSTGPLLPLSHLPLLYHGYIVRGFKTSDPFISHN